ncbi:heme-binding protein soul4 [Corythoichthys intestinalis]|uniref:heme-binding protein soul4 n=1 Tax=Corythoichthys intestinalis TaxID=161448 RepID=UPI0025A5F5B2|nr:heme-binding protein soul4 [Corythoichthys intestinalis]XP_057699730.1 heme-binding protein soul4 [Corythoichthys intestinalis]XP_061791346.1 heme-binding protein 1-like [Nerophis lumbriciformis]
MALISLEDLEGLDEDEDIADVDAEAQPMGEEQSDNLLAHWRAVGRTHHVSVPAEMRGPIHEMTRNNQQREPVPFAPLSRQEKMGELMWEERAYPAGKWACVRHAEEFYEQSISQSFMKLMRFICKENSEGHHLGMTVPVVSTVALSSDGKTMDKSVLTAFYLPAAYQASPPQPSDPDVIVAHRDAFTVVAGPFFGTTTEETVTRHAGLLRELLGPAAAQSLRSDIYMVAVYENPGVPRRRNEIWFLRR